jgi:hypothetical protein
MTPDRVSFQLTDNCSISVGEGQVGLLIGDEFTYIEGTNFGKFLLESCFSVIEGRFAVTAGSIQ